VALEATGNSDAIANLLTPLVGRVVVSNPSRTRAIAEAKVKAGKSWCPARRRYERAVGKPRPHSWVPAPPPIIDNCAHGAAEEKFR
jgi:hypothetical protein